MGRGERREGGLWPQVERKVRAVLHHSSQQSSSQHVITCAWPADPDAPADEAR